MNKEELYPVDVIAIISLQTLSPIDINKETLQQEARDQLTRALIDTDFKIDEIIVEF